MTATTASLPSSLRFESRSSGSFTAAPSAQPEPLDEYGGKEQQGDRAHDQGQAQVVRLLGRHGTSISVLLQVGGTAGGPRRLARPALHYYFTSGGVSKVWNGAGDGTVHSRPSAPSHGLSAAFWPPRMVGSTTNSRKYTCARPKPKAPIETMALKSVNWVG